MERLNRDNVFHRIFQKICHSHICSISVRPDYDHLLDRNDPSHFSEWKKKIKLCVFFLRATVGLKSLLADTKSP